MNLLITIMLPNGNKDFIVLYNIQTVMPVKGAALRHPFLVFQSHDGAIMTSIPEHMIEDIDLTIPRF